jgi:hypothetical protein
MTASTVLIDPLMDPAAADAMVQLCQDFGGYGLYVSERSEGDFAPELAQRYDAAANHVRTGGRFGRRERGSTLALRTNYLRESYAYGDEILAPGIEAFLHHEALIEAARSLYGREVIVPAIAYANILLPGQELAVHTDVPEFRGANRKLFPQWLLVVMHHSGLFERWRMPIATGIAYFADESAGRAVGGELAYWPGGADAPVAVLENRHNTAIVLDTDSVFHGVDRVGSLETEPVAVTPGNVLVHDGQVWVLRSERHNGSPLASFGWDEIRFSVSWKAYCFADEAEREAWRRHDDDLSLDLILAQLVADLRAQGALTTDELTERELALLMIETYERYPAPTPNPSPEPGRQPGRLRPEVGSEGLAGGGLAEPGLLESRGRHIDPGRLDPPGAQLHRASDVGGVGGAHVERAAVLTPEGAGVGRATGRDPVDGTGPLDDPHHAPVDRVGHPDAAGGIEADAVRDVGPQVGPDPGVGQ